MNAARNHSRLQFGGPSRITSRHGANGHRNSRLAISSPGLSSTLELRIDDQPHSSSADHSVTPRDAAILMALDSYRYLDRTQIQTLFFTGPRSCQYRLRWLVHHGLVRTWRVVMRPGRVCRASIFLLSQRGAAALAEWLDAEPLSFVRRAEHALERRFHLVHQLEANQFFVDLAAATRGMADCGLYHWVGEHGVENAYAESDERAPIPDGWGRLLTPDREVLIDRESCRFWTTTTAFITANGPLGQVWAGNGSLRVGLKEMGGQPRSEREIDA